MTIRKLMGGLLLAIPALLSPGRSLAQAAELYSAVISAEADSAATEVTVLSKLLDGNKHLDDFITAVFEDSMMFYRHPFSAGDTAAIRSIGANKSQLRSKKMPVLQHSKTISLITQRRYGRLFRKRGIGGWQLYYQHYPRSGGHFEFSPLRFSVDGQYAMFYHRKQNHGLEGHGAISLAQRGPDGHWRLIAHFRLWVS